jgi:hypothetical protein
VPESSGRASVDHYTESFDADDPFLDKEATNGSDQTTSGPPSFARPLHLPELSKPFQNLFEAAKTPSRGGVWALATPPASHVKVGQDLIPVPFSEHGLNGGPTP